MAGVATISFDCEGKWGVADHLTPSHQLQLCDERLRWAYREITRLLDRYSLAATFAFVGLFARPFDELRKFPLRKLAEDLPYLRAAADAIEKNDEGWSGEWAIDLIGPDHEIAFHGLTHVPWPQLTRQQAEQELAHTPPAHRRTMIFPRHLVAHLDVVEASGCLGFRAAKPFNSRLASFASEFNVLSRSDAPAKNDIPIEIPAGVFINWRSGLRSLVPPALTRARAKHILRHASQTGGVAHFWIHPENIASHPATLENLKIVVEEIADAREAGLANIETQVEYCKRIAS